MALSQPSRVEYLAAKRQQYKQANKQQRGRLLDDVVELTGYHRKYLIGLLGRPFRPRLQRTGRAETRGSKVRYGTVFDQALIKIWHIENGICGDLLQPFLKHIVPKLEQCGELEVSSKVREQLLAVSISTVRRRLSKAARRSTIPLGTTKPGSLLKSQIAVRRGRWDESAPGWLETDTVAHCGEVNQGTYINTYDFVDIYSSWSEQIASLGKGELATVAAVESVEGDTPFPWLGIDSDNGGEFINGHLHRYAVAHKLAFTRSRPYHKNDNAHVEQKNWTAVRKLVGYQRLDTPEQLQILNELYRGPWRLYLNFFQPTRKRKLKIIDPTTNHTTKYYFEAKTPYRRLMEHSDVPPATKAMLQSRYNQLNPVKLKAEIEALVDRLHQTLR